MSTGSTRLRELLEEPLLVTNLVNVLYLTGFDSSNAALLVEPDRARLFTDFRYLEARAERSKASRSCRRSGRSSAGSRDELDGPHRLRGERPPVVVRGAAARGRARARAAHRGSSSGCGPSRTRASSTRSGGRARSPTGCSSGSSSEVPFVGRRERDVAWDIQRLFHEEGADELAFESIVGSGPTGARPHARAGDRVIEAGELVVIDTGCRVDGYCSDYTRTFATGELADELRDGVRRRLARAAGGARRDPAPA